MVAPQDVPFDEEQEHHYQYDGHDGDYGDGMGRLGSDVMLQLEAFADEGLFLVVKRL